MCREMVGVSYVVKGVSYVGAVSKMKKEAALPYDRIQEQVVSERVFCLCLKMIRFDLRGWWSCCM